MENNKTRNNERIKMLTSKQEGMARTRVVMVQGRLILSIQQSIEAEATGSGSRAGQGRGLNLSRLRQQDQAGAAEGAGEEVADGGRGGRCTPPLPFLGGVPHLANLELQKAEGRHWGGQGRVEVIRMLYEHATAHIHTTMYSSYLRCSSKSALSASRSSGSGTVG